MVRKDVKLPPIGATPNFNSHMSVIAPKEKDDIETQFDHSQIYLYEMEANKVVVKRPRHCLPYAVVSWLKLNDGNEWPLNFGEADTNLTNGVDETGLGKHVNALANGINGEHEAHEKSGSDTIKGEPVDQSESSRQSNDEATNGIEVKQEDRTTNPSSECGTTRLVNFVTNVFVCSCENSSNLLKSQKNQNLNLKK